MENAIDWVPEGKTVLESVRRNGLILKDIEDQTDELCLAAVASNHRALYYVKNQTEEICIAAIHRSAEALALIRDQTEEICLEAMKQAGLALRYVKNQTEEICLEAVRQNGKALGYVENQTEEIYLEAMENPTFRDTMYERMRINGSLSINTTPIEDRLKCIKDLEMRERINQCVMNKRFLKTKSAKK